MDKDRRIELLSRLCAVAENENDAFVFTNLRQCLAHYGLDYDNGEIERHVNAARVNKIWAIEVYCGFGEYATIAEFHSCRLAYAALEAIAKTDKRRKYSIRPNAQV